MNLENNENSEAKCPICGAPQYAGCEHSSNNNTTNNEESEIKDPQAWNKALTDFNRLVESSTQQESKYHEGKHVNISGPDGNEVICKIVKTEKGIYLLELKNESGTYTAGVAEENEITNN